MHASTAVLVAGLLASGCVGDGAHDATGPRPDEPAEPAALAPPDLMYVEGDWVLGVSAAGARNDFVGSGHPGVKLGGEHVALVAELVWEPATPVASALTIDVMHDEDFDRPLASASGESPLRLSVPPEAFEGPGIYGFIVHARGEPAGAFVAQSYGVHVAAFTQGFDPGVAFEG